MTNFIKRPHKPLRRKEGAPRIQRPSKSEAEAFPQEAQDLIQHTEQQQTEALKNKQYHIQQLTGKHFILAGATGPGLGGALACGVLRVIQESGSLTILSRDLQKSIGFETGKHMQELATQRGIQSRFAWLNDGMALEGAQFEKILDTLKSLKAEKLIYINTVAAASSGMIDQKPNVHVKDIDDSGLFEWTLLPLSEKEIHSTRYFMGEMAINFPKLLKQHGFEVEIAVFADWRGSLDTSSRDPRNPEYGRQGAYSTSLYLPKDIIQRHIRRTYKTADKCIDIFYPIMRTRALRFIPGGTLMALLSEKLMHKAKIPKKGIPQLALETLEHIYENLHEGNDNPFPRLDTHELELDLWFHEILQKLTDDEASAFYYKQWI